MIWLNERLKLKTRAAFEQKYGRVLTDSEVEQIAYNLAELMETIFRFEWRMKYGTKA